MLLSPAGTDQSTSPSRRRAVRSWSIEVARDERSRSIVLGILLVLLFRQTIAAPIRAYVPFFWYIPDVFMLGAFLILIYVGAKERVLAMLIFTGFVLILVGYAMVANPIVDVVLQARQVGYVILAAFAGMGIRRGNQFIAKAIVVAGGLAILGVYYDYLIGVPWANAVFEGALQTKEVSREWWGNGGERRLSGFGLASTDTAVVIAVGALTMCAVTQSRIRIASALFAAAAVHTLLLTTQKATAAWLVIVLLVAYAVPLLMPRRNSFGSAPFLRILAVGGLCACILVPMIFFGARLGQDFSVNAPTLDQRTSEVWPAAIPMLGQFPQLLLGYGLGAVGQTATIPSLALVDNMFLFIALMVGAPLTLLIFAVSAYGLWKAPMRDPLDFSALAMAALLILNGITANMVGTGGVGSMFLGMAIGILLRPTRRRSSSNTERSTERSPERRTSRSSRSSRAPL